MIVDEEPGLVSQMKTFLENEDLQVVTALNSRQALGQLKDENEETFDLILINTTMPISKKNALFSMKPTIKKQPSGVEHFLPKPFTKDQLISFIKQQMEK